MKYKWLFLFTIIILLLTGCQQSSNEKGYYIKLLFNENSNAYQKQKVTLDAIKKDLQNEYNTELELIDVVQNAKDDSLINKVVKLNDNSNTLAVYDKENKNKLIAITTGVFNTANDIMVKINEEIEIEKQFYEIEGVKYLYVHNSHDIKYKDLKRFSSVRNLKEVIYDEKSSNYLNKIANNYYINPNDDDLLIFDNNNNLLIQFNMENVNYFTNPSDGSINLDATIISHILKISPNKDKNKLIYFYNSQDNSAKQIEELNNFIKKSKDEYQLISVPLENNDAKINAIMQLVKEIFNISDNQSAIFYIDSFNNFNNKVVIGNDKTSENLLNYFQMKKLK